MREAVFRNCTSISDPMSEPRRSAINAPAISPLAQGCVGERPFGSLRIAVLIPCYNEVHAVTAVIRDFCAHLPCAQIYVYDNNSTDGTAAAAREAGAIVRSEPLQGKGHVVRRMFSDVEADIYLLVDGDDTYDAGSAPKMVQLLLEHQLDMVNGARFNDIDAAWRPG